MKYIAKALLLVSIVLVSGIAFGQTLEQANDAFERKDYAAALTRWTELNMATYVMPHY